MSTNETSSFVELDRKPEIGAAKKRKYYFPCRCHSCAKGEGGFTWQTYQTIWRGLDVENKNQWEPKRPSNDSRQGHLRTSLDRFHTSRLRPEDKDGLGRMSAAKEQELKALKDRIQMCSNEQSGDAWWKHASLPQTTAGTSGGTIDASDARLERPGAGGLIAEPGSSLPQSSGLHALQISPQSPPSPPNPADDEHDIYDSDYTPSPMGIGPATDRNIQNIDVQDGRHRGDARAVDHGDEGDQDEEEEEEEEEGDDMNEDEEEEEGVEETAQAYLEVEPTAQPTLEPMDPSRVEDPFLTALGQIFGDSHVPRLVKALGAAFQKGLSRSGMDAVGRILTESPSCPKGKSVIPFLDKVRLPTMKSYTCLDRHELYSDKSSTCKTCEQEQAANPEKQVDATMQRHSVHLPLHVLFQHFMQQRPFADAIRSGPEFLKRSLAQRPSQQNNPGGRTIIRNVWESPAMSALHEQVDMTCTERRIPVALEYFTDGVQPTQSHGQDMWVVLFKVLNLPPTLANDFMVSVTIIGSKKKPKSIDVYLRQLVDEMGRSIKVPDISNPGKELELDLYLFCSAQDSMAMPLVARHQCFPGNYACHLCHVKAVRIKKPNAKTYRGACPVYPATDPQGEPFPAKDDAMAKIINDFCDKASVKSVGTGVCGYKGTPAFGHLFANGFEYFGQSTGFVTCIMHLVMNQVKRGWEHAQGCSTWSTEDLATWLRTPMGQQCQANYGMTIDAADPPWQMNKWPNRDRVSPVKRDAGLAFEAASHAKLPTAFHGKPTLLLHKGKKSKDKAELSYSRSIKAAEWKDAAISGMLSYLEALAGVDPKIVSARAALYRAVKTLCARHVDVIEVQEIHENMPGIIKRMSDLLPPTEQTISLHGFVHLPVQVLHFGPFVFIWSYPFEGYFAFLKPVAQLNTACPDTTAMSRVATLLGIQGWLAAHTPPPPEAAPTLDDLWGIHPQITALYRGSPGGKEQNPFQSFPRESAVQLVSAVEEFYRSTTWRNAPSYNQVIRSLKSNQVTILYYDRLTIGDVQVQGVDNQATAKDNEWLILRKTDAGPLPRLAHVQAIYRVQVREKTNGMADAPRIIEDRLLLHVAEYCLGDVDDELKQCGLQEFMHMWRCDQTPVHRLIDVSSIDEQAIRMPDPRDPDCKGYHRYVIMDKGTWQNMDLKNPFSPSLTIKST